MWQRSIIILVLLISTFILQRTIIYPATIDLKAYETKIEDAWDRGDTKTLEQIIQELTLKVNDNNVEGLVLLARAYYRYSLFYDESANISNQHWFDNPKYFSLNETYWKKGEELIDKAFDIIKKADEKAPDSPKVLPYYSLITYRKIRHCSMITALPYMKGFLNLSKKTIEVCQNDPVAVLSKAIMELGRSPKMGGNPRNAYNYFQKVFQLNPDYAEAYFWFGRFYMSPDIKVQPNLALPNFEKAVSLNPQNWLYKITLEEFKKIYPK